MQAGPRSPGAVALKLDVQVSVLRERDFEHGRVESLVQQVARNVPAIQFPTDLAQRCKHVRAGKRSIS